MYVIQQKARILKIGKLKGKYFYDKPILFYIHLTTTDIY